MKQEAWVTWKQQKMDHIKTENTKKINHTETETKSKTKSKRSHGNGQHG